MRIVKARPFRLMPKYKRPLLAGADGWDGGSGILFLWWMLIIKEPENNVWYGNFGQY